MRVVVGGAFGLSPILMGCPVAGDDVDPPPGAPRPILAQFIVDHPEACTDLFDRDGNGSFEEQRHVFVDDQQRIVRRIQRVDGVGLSDQLLLPLDVDGEVHDEERFATTGDFVPRTHGNTHFFYEDGRLAREVAEGSDSRFRLAQTFYTYNGDNLVSIDAVSANEQNFRSSLVEFDYDGDGLVVERRIDLDRDGGVDQTDVTSRTSEPDGSGTVTITRTNSLGTSVEVFSFDPFQVMLRREFDAESDGVVDKIIQANVKDGTLAGYDFDVDGAPGFEVEQAYVVDEVAHTFTVTSREDGTIVDRQESDYACFFVDVDRGAARLRSRTTRPLGARAFASRPPSSRPAADPLSA
ncbi:MAG: hypothetical protein Q8O67_08865 [Deltaproteobacteria bacterium]|nr:hypothetical protein [Deltaproteobacteria bacterium]